MIRFALGFVCGATVTIALGLMAAAHAEKDTADTGTYDPWLWHVTRPTPVRPNGYDY